MYPHRIHLRGPWEAEPVAVTTIDAHGQSVPVAAALPPKLSMVLPGRWAAAGWPDFWGRARFRRRFQWVKPLTDRERLWLGCLGCDGLAEVTLNGTVLGTHDEPFTPFTFDVTHFIRDRNELVIEVDAPSDPQGRHLPRGRRGVGGGLWGTVFLEVRRDLCLDDLAVVPVWRERQPWLHCSGQLLGLPAGSVHLALRVATEELAFVTLAEAGRFDLQRPLPPGLARWQPEGQGLPHLHLLQIDLQDQHATLDHREITFGIAEVAWADPETVLINGERRLRPADYHLVEPLLEAATLEAADRQGRLFVGVLPFSEPAGLPAGLRAAALQLAEQVRRLTAHHPCLVGWEYAS